MTDLTYGQSLVQRWFDVDEIVVQTASSGNQLPELTIVGLKDFAKQFLI